MYSYITCYCGRPIGDIDDLFLELRRFVCYNYLTENNIETLPDMLPSDERLQVDLNEVFDALHLDTECCRARIMSQIKFTELY